MQCNHCGNPVEVDNTICPECGEVVQTKIQVLSPEERENFDGMTIEEEKHETDDTFEYQRNTSNGRVYVRQISFGNSPGGIINKIIIGAVILGLVIVALPLALAVLGILLLSWFAGGLRRR